MGGWQKYSNTIIKCDFMGKSEEQTDTFGLGLDRFAWMDRQTDA